jgi:hypothetical protein
MRIKFAAVPLVGMLLIGFTTSGFAQSGVAKVEISFPFQVGDKEMPPGNYEIRSAPSGNFLVIRSSADGQSTQVPVITRISSRAKETALYFDKSDGKSYLSEVYFGGMDGFHLKGSPGKHTHMKVDARTSAISK